MVALYFGRIRTRLGVVHFQVLRLFFEFIPVSLQLVEATNRDNYLLLKHFHFPLSPPFTNYFVRSSRYY